MAVSLEGERAGHQRPGMALAYDDVAFAGERLAGVLVEHRLAVEGVDVRDAAHHEERNNGFGARREVRAHFVFRRHQLRKRESAIGWLPFGAQYLVWGQKPRA